MAILRAVAILHLISCLANSSDIKHQEQLLVQWNNISTSSIEEFEPVNNSCPPWKYDKYHNSGCVCGDKIHDIVKCQNDQSTVSLLTCHCMSYSEYHVDEVVVGECPYLCTNKIYTEIHNHTNLSDLCNRDINQNRQGQMCGQCLDNHSPSPYSYRLSCAHCSNCKYNCIKYLLMAYLPLTVFFLMVIFFRFNALSASMNAFIFYCQIISCPAVMSLLSNFVYFSKKHPGDRNINVTATLKGLATSYGLSLIHI